MPTKKPHLNGARVPSIDNDMLVDLHRSGLNERDVKLLQLKWCATAPAGIEPAATGYVIPYFSMSGELTGFYRYRYLADTRSGFEKLSGAKQRRYTQPPGTTPQVYWPPNVNWHAINDNTDHPVVITEGEKKAARCSKGGFPCIGLGGVWSFQNAAKGQGLLGELEHFNWEGREIYIIYDSDAVDKIQVQQAEYRLAHRLADKGAVIKIVRLPGSPNGDKRGLDDYIQAYSVEDLRELCGEAEPFEQSRALHQMNTEVTYVKDPGIVYVLDTGQLVAPSDFKTHRFADRHYFRHRLNSKGDDKPEERSTATDWLAWAYRSAVERLEFEPGQPTITPSGALNLWRGWTYKPKAGDVSPWTYLMDHLFRGQPASRKWVEQWCAYPFQHPGTKHRTAVAIWGRQTGTGKSAIGYTLGDLYGDAFSEIGDDQIEKNDFNSWARNKQFVLGDDITGNNNRRVANALKRMVSREELQINIKHVPEYYTRDCINYFFTSNSPDAFLLDETDRRFFVHEVVARPLPDDFYEDYHRWRKSLEGRQALMHHFINEVDVSDFSPTSRAPMTAAKADMIALTRTDLEHWLTQVRDDADTYCKKFGNCDLVTINELMLLYDPQNTHKVTPITFARKLKELDIPRCDPNEREPGAQIRLGSGELVRLYALRNRDKWVKATTSVLREHYEACRKMKPKQGKF